MKTHDEYADQMAATLKQWAAELGALQAKARDAGTEQKAKFESAISALQVQQTAYQDQMGKVRTASEAAFADLRSGSERMAEEFGKAYQQAAGRFAV